MAIIVLAGFSTLVYYYRRIFFLFLKPQAYSHPWRDETAHVVILEEVEEKLPEKAKIVEEIILKLKSLNKRKKA